MRSTDRSRDRVIICWMRSAEGSVQALAYNSGHGPLRVYERDKYDARLGTGSVPFFKTSREALAWMVANPGEPCQVTLKVGAEWFGRTEIAESIA